MKLENIANLSEIFSSIAIVITLIVLVLEVQGNTAALQRQIDIDRASRINESMDSPYIPAIFAKIKEVDPDAISNTDQVFMERYGLTFEEATRITRYFRFQWRGHEADFISDAPGQEGRDAEMKVILRFPENALFWELSQDGFNQDFVAHVNSLIQSTSG